MDKIFRFIQDNERVGELDRGRIFRSMLSEQEIRKYRPNCPVLIQWYDNSKIKYIINNMGEPKKFINDKKKGVSIQYFSDTLLQFNDASCDIKYNKYTFSIYDRLNLNKDMQYIFTLYHEENIYLYVFYKSIEDSYYIDITKLNALLDVKKNMIKYNINGKIKKIIKNNNILYVILDDANVYIILPNNVPVKTNNIVQNIGIPCCPYRNEYIYITDDKKKVLFGNNEISGEIKDRYYLDCEIKDNTVYFSYNQKIFPSKTYTNKNIVKKVNIDYFGSLRDDCVSYTLINADFSQITNATGQKFTEVLKEKLKEVAENIKSIINSDVIIAKYNLDSKSYSEYTEKLEICKYEIEYKRVINNDVYSIKWKLDGNNVIETHRLDPFAIECDIEIICKKSNKDNTYICVSKSYTLVNKYKYNIFYYVNDNNTLQKIYEGSLSFNGIVDIIEINDLIYFSSRDCYFTLTKKNDNYIKYNQVYADYGKKICLIPKSSICVSSLEKKEDEDEDEDEDVDVDHDWDD
jgi:hypothetical protein